MPYFSRTGNPPHDKPDRGRMRLPRCAIPLRPGITLHGVAFCGVIKTPAAMVVPAIFVAQRLQDMQR